MDMARCYKSGTSSCDPRRTSRHFWACVQNVVLSPQHSQNGTRRWYRVSFWFLLGLGAVPAGAAGSSATGPRANAVRSPRPPLPMNGLQVQLLIYTHAVLAVLHMNRYKHIQFPAFRLRTSTRDCCRMSPHSWEQRPL